VKPNYGSVPQLVKPYQQELLSAAIQAALAKSKQHSAAPRGR
jgi:hypothetical protein